MAALHTCPPSQHNTHVHRNLHTTEGSIIPLKSIYDLRVCVPQVTKTRSNFIYSCYRSGNSDLKRDMTCPRLRSGFEAPPDLLSLPCWLGEPVWGGVLGQCPFQLPSLGLHSLQASLLQHPSGSWGVRASGQELSEQLL